jgi:5-methyltetrahydrofolate--homocysteine methyltransferase
MKEVGDKFGAGELILPFVLQSAEVMKKAVKHLEGFLEKAEGYTKGKVVLATVYGDVHDIGKSLVNTILSNNGYTVFDLGKQVPVNTIIEKALEVGADAIGLSALLVSTSKQMPLCVQELDKRGIQLPVLIGGAAINRRFGRRAMFVEAERAYESGVFYCKDAFEGLAVMDRLVEPERRAELVTQIRDAAAKLREVGEEEEVLDTTDASVRSAARTDAEVPEPPFWGVREIEVDREELYTHLDTHVLFKLHWGGRGVKGEEWRRLLAEDFRPRLERMWNEATYLHPRALLGYFPCYSEGNDIVVLDPDDRETVIERFTCPRQPKGDRLCLADFYRSKDSGELDVVALQAVTVGDEVTELMARLEQEGEFAEQLFVHGLGVQTAEGLAEWLHWRVRNDLGIDVRQGRRYAWGYPSIPDQSEHTKLDNVLRLERIGMTITDGFAPVPEQSTLAIVAHHPQAIYFGMRNGRLLPDGSPDDVIRRTARDPSLFGELRDDDEVAAGAAAEAAAAR